MTATCWDSSTSRRARKSRHEALDVGARLTRHQRERDRVGKVGRKRLGLRPVYGHHDGRMQVGAVELSQHPHGVAHLGEPLARSCDGHAPFAELVFDPRPAGADTHLEATLGQHRQRMGFPRRAPRGTQRRRIHPGAHPQVGEGRGESQRGAGRRLKLREVRHQQRRVAAVGEAPNAVSPRGQVSRERHGDPEAKRSSVTGRPRVGHGSAFRRTVGARLVVERRSVDEFLGATVERPRFDQVEVEIGRILEDRIRA